MSTIAAPTAIRRPRPAPVVRRRAAAPRSVLAVRRLVALLVSTAVLAATVVVAGQLGSAASVPQAPALEVVVQPGDTIWELAATHRPAGTSTQDYAMAVVLHNDLTATALRPGTIVELPGAGGVAHDPAG